MGNRKSFNYKKFMKWDGKGPVSKDSVVSVLNEALDIVSVFEPLNFSNETEIWINLE